MRVFSLLFLFFISFDSFCYERKALNTVHPTLELIDKEGFSIYYNKLQECTLLFNSISPADFENKFVNDNDKIYWLLTETIYEILKKHAIQGGNAVCLAIWHEGIYKNILLKLSSSDLYKLNTRKFNKKDFDFHSLLPVRKILSKAQILKFDINGSKLRVSQSLTEQYKNFLSDYSFSNRHERTVEINHRKYLASYEGVFYHIQNGNLDKVKQYVEYNFDVNRKDNENQQTLLQYAAVHGHFNIVKLLLNNGADPNIRETNSENAYLAAKRMGYSQVVELLEPITKVKTRSSKSNSSSNLSDKCSNLSGEFGAWSACMKNEDTVFAMGKKGLNAYYAINRQCDNLAGNDNTGLSYLCEEESRNGCVGLKAPQNVIDACYQCNGSNLWLRVFAMGKVLQCY